MIKRSFVPLFTTILLVISFLVLFSAIEAQNAPDVVYALTTDKQEGQLVYVGLTENILSQVNPTLSANPGDTVEIRLLNVDNTPDQLKVDVLNLVTGELTEIGAMESLTFTAETDAEYFYYSPLSGQQNARGIVRFGAPTQAAAEPVIEQETVASAFEGVEYTLKTAMPGNPAMAFIGVGGDIEGVVNPVLNATTGQAVRINVINGDPVLHDLTVDVFNVSTGQLVSQGQEGSVTFTPSAPGEYFYRCSVPGHEQIGMKGSIKVTGEATTQTVSAETTTTTDHAAMDMPAEAAPAAIGAASIIRNPADVPAPVGDREPMTVQVNLNTVEVTGQLADGTTFNYFTFDGKIPGPMIRVRVGDLVELKLHNDATSVYHHSIDLHAVTGPGGGAVYTQTHPDGDTTFSFTALNPGLYVYHCATPSVAHHIANGMYGLILVEPKGGLPPVDREFYVMQGEIYTSQPFGTTGHMEFNYDAMLDEDPEYFVFNGASMGLTTDENALRANVGETVRIFFGVGGPNFTSSFHVIGEIFDRVYDQASLTSAPLTDVQTTLVPTGGATMVEFKLDVPGRYILVDHSLSRLERGLAAFLYADGDEAPVLFHGDELTAGSGH